MTLHNIYHYVNQDVAKISSSLFLTIILIKNIHLSVAGQTFEVSIKKRLINLSDLKATFLLAVLAITMNDGNMRY